MSSWKEIVGDEDPYLFHLSEEARNKLESAADEMQDFWIEGISLDVEKIVSIAELAGEAILEIYSNPESINIQHKGDNSPLTEADLAAHNIIVEELQKIYKI